MWGFSRCGFNGPSTSPAEAKLWLQIAKAAINLRNGFCIRTNNAMPVSVVNVLNPGYSLVKNRMVF